jgi:hypothetical protein
MNHKKILIILAFLTIFSNCRKIIRESIKELTEDTTEKTLKTYSKKEISSVSKTLKTYFKDSDLKFEETKNNLIKVFSKKNDLLGEIRGNTVTSFPGYNLNSMNKLLDKRKLLPNFTYKIENVIYKTDNIGRVVEAHASYFPKSILKKPRSSYRQSRGNYEKNGFLEIDNGGHLIPNQLGGISELINIVPQNRILNNGEWKKVENFVTKNREYIKDYKVNLIYEGNSMRPKDMEVSYVFKNKKYVETFANESRILNFK